MDSSDSLFSNLDIWCDWSGDPIEPVQVCMSVEVWCTPNSQITLLDTSHPCVLEVVDFTLNPIVKFDPSNDVRLLQEDTVTNTISSASTRDSPASDHQSQVPVTPTKQAKPVSPDANTSRASLFPSHPNLQIDTHTPSDSGSVLRARHTPDGSPADSLDAFYASFYRDGSSSEFLGEVGQSPTNPRKRNAKAASLPDSVTDSERSYGGAKLNSRDRILTKGKQSPVSSSSSQHSRTRSFLPRPVSVTNHVRLDPTMIPLPSDSVPVLDVDFRRFENGVLPVEKEIWESHLRGEQDSVADTSSGDTLTPLASPTARTSLDISTRDACKSPQEGQDVEKLSNVASAGSPCDTTLMSDSDDASFGGFPGQGNCVVQTPTPPQSLSRPRLEPVGQVFQVHCPSGLEPAWYKATVAFVLRLQSGRPRGWYELVLQGLPRLDVKDHGYVYLHIPNSQGLEYRTMQFKRYEVVEGCIIAQFRLIQSKLVIPLRPCDARFYGFLRDFKVSQTIRTQVKKDQHDSSSCIVEYTAVCSLDLIQRDFWAEKCAFYLYIHGGPEGELACHLDAPKTRFQTIQLDSDPASEFGITQLQVICAPANLNMFALTWERRMPRWEASSWVPRITALPVGCHVEEELQSRYLEAEEDEQEIVRGEVKSRLVVPKRVKRRGGFVRCLVRAICWLVFLFMILGSVFYSVGLSDRALGEEVRREVENILCSKVKLCVRKSSEEELSLHHTEETHIVPEMSEVVDPMGSATEGATKSADVIPSPVLEDIGIQSVEREPARLTPMPLRDRIDYLLGWKGPLPPAGF